MLFRVLIALMLCISIPSLTAFAISPDENGVGTVSGRIMGAMLPVNGAEVMLLDKDKVVDKINTDAEGKYEFLHVRPGVYDVKCSKTEYRTSIIIKVPVHEDKVTPNDMYLPKFNNSHMPKTPVTDSYENNCKKYMRQK